MTTLSPSQRFMLDKISSKTVRDYELNATASSSSSDPDEVAMILNSREDQIKRHFRKIRKRKHMADRRVISLYRVAHGPRDRVKWRIDLSEAILPELHVQLSEARKSLQLQ